MSSTASTPAEHSNGSFYVLRVVPPQEPDQERWTLATGALLALLFNALVIMLLLLKPDHKQPVIPPSIPVELVKPQQLKPQPKPQAQPKQQEQQKPQEKPKPEEKKPEEKKPEEKEKPKPEQKIRESGGSPDLKIGRAPEPDKEVAKQPHKTVDQNMPVPNAPDRDPSWAMKTEKGYGMPDSEKAPSSKKEKSYAKSDSKSEKSSKAAPTLSRIGGEGGGDAYLNEIRDRIGSKVVYPPNVIRGMVGPFQVGLVLGFRGNVLNAQVLTSSGSVDFDNAILQAIEAAAPFPPFPRDIPDSMIQLVFQGPGA